MTAEEQLTKLTTAKTLAQAVREERDTDDELDDALEIVTERLGVAQDLLDEEVHAP